MAKILNTVFLSLTAFWLCFVWIVYCVKNAVVGALVACVVAVAIGYIVWNGQKLGARKQSESKQKRKQATCLAEFLRFGENNAELIAKMMRYYRFDVVEAQGDELIADKDGCRSIVTIRYMCDEVKQETLCQAVVLAKRSHCDKLYLFADKADKNALEKAREHFDITFVDTANLLELLEQCQMTPALKQCKRPKQNNVVLHYAFNKKRVGWYLCASLFCLAISVISVFPWYMLAWATINLGLAVYCTANKRYNALPTRVTLD